MPRARRKPAVLQTTDTGPDTPAQRLGAVYHRPRDGRPGDRRKTREHPLVAMAARGALTGAQRDRGMSAVKLYEATEMSCGEMREYVDGSPDPSMAVVNTLDAKRKYAMAVATVPARCRRVFNHVVEAGQYMICMRGCRTSHTERWRQVKLLRIALDKLNV